MVNFINQSIAMHILLTELVNKHSFFTRSYGALENFWCSICIGQLQIISAVFKISYDKIKLLGNVLNKVIEHLT